MIYVSISKWLFGFGPQGSRSEAATGEKEIMIPSEHGPFKQNIKGLVVLSVLLLSLPYAYTGSMPVKVFRHANVPLASSAVPVLRQGDIWHYYLGIEGNSNESIRRTVPCGNVRCIVSSEVNAAYNDTLWIVRGNWSLVREYCVGCDGYNFITNTVYTPPRQLFAFPLQPAEPWWNGTASGWTSNAGLNVNFSNPVSILRRVINETSVIVHAGSFDTFLVAEYGQSGIVLDGYLWFSLEAETSVKALSLNSLGEVIDSRELITYRIVGVNPGEFVRLGNISVDYESNDTNPELAGSSLRDVDSIEATIQSVTGTSVILGIVTSFKNGTQSIMTNTTNISTGSPPPTSLGPFVIEAGLRSGNTIPNWQGMTLNFTRSISYLGTFREVNILNSTQALQPPVTGWIRLLRYWDRASGFLLATRTDMNETYSRNGSSYFLVESISARVVSTNLWQGFIPGFKAGDWVKYGDFSASSTSDISGDQNIVKSYQDTYWRMNSVLEVFGSNVTVESTAAFANATVSIEYRLLGDVSAGNGNLTSYCLVPCLLAANLRAGDPVSDPAYSSTVPTINQTGDRIYLGVHRRVNILNVTSTISGPYNGIFSKAGIYDQVTGVLLEFFYTSFYQNYTRIASSPQRIPHANLWNATRLPDFSITVLPAMLSIRPGSSGTSKVILSSLHGFADSVNIAVLISPTGPNLGAIPGRLTVTASPMYSTSSFLLKVSATNDLPAGIFNVTLIGSSGPITHKMTFSVLVYRPIPLECGIRGICYIIANVTISDVKSTISTIHFAANGPHGIIANTNVTIPTTSLPNPDSLEVFIDKALLPQSAVETTIDPTGHGYLVHFTFTIHGPVNVDLLLGGSQAPPTSPQPFLKLNPTSIGIIGVSTAIIVSLGVEAFRKISARRRPQNSPEQSKGSDGHPRWASVLKYRLRIKIRRLTRVGIPS